jgi:hypothetical protein
MSHQHRSSRHRSDYVYSTAELLELAEAAESDEERELFRAKANLATRLAALGDPVVDALTLIGPEEFSVLAWRIPNPSRSNFLSDLHVPPARKPTTAAAAHGLDRMRNWQTAHRHQGARCLTYAVMSSLDTALHTWSHDREDDALRHAVNDNPVGYGPTRLAALVHWASNPGAVAVLRIAMDGPLALSSWSPSDRNMIIEACRTVEKLWLPAHTPPAPIAPLNGSAAESDSGEGEAAVDLEWFEQSGAALAELFERAEQAVEEAGRTLQGGGVPTADSVAPLEILRHGVQSLREGLAARTSRLLDEVHENRQELTEALRSAGASAQERQRHTAALGRLALVQVPDRTALIDEVCELARQLDAAAGLWTEEQRGQAEALTALVGLIDATTAGADDDLITELQDKAQGSLPAQFRSLVTAAVRGRLSFPDEAESPLPSSSAGVDSDVEVSDGVSEEPESETAIETPGDDTVPGPTVSDAAYNAAAVADTSAKRVSTAGAPRFQQEMTPAAATETAQDSADVAETALPQPRPSDEYLVAELLDAGECALAYHAAEVTGAQPLAAALRTFTLAEAVRSESGPSAADLHDHLEALCGPGTPGDRVSALIALCAAIRAALLTADPSMGQVVNTLIAAVHDLPHVTLLAAEVGRASERGQLSGGEALAALAPLAGGDEAIRRASIAARANLDQPRTLNFERANEIVARWWAPNGSIGALLDAAAHDRREQVPDVVEQLRQFSKRSRLNKELNGLDAEFRASGRVLQGAARRKLLEYAEDSVTAINAWVQVARSEGSDSTDGKRPLSNRLAHLRDKVHAHWTEAVCELEALESADSGVLASAACACRKSLETSVGLLDGRALLGKEAKPAVVLNLDLVRCPGLPISTNLGLSREPTPDELRTAARRSWREAFDARVGEENFSAARIARDVLAEAEPGAAVELDAVLEGSAAASREALGALHTTVTAKVELAARRGLLAESGRSEVTAQLEGADLGRDDLGTVRGLLTRAESELPGYAHVAKDAFRTRVRTEIDKRPGQISENAVKAIEDRIDADDLATAEEYLLAALVGEQPPSAKQSKDLEGFFPRVPEAVRDGINAELVDAVRGGATFGPVSFDGLSAEERESVAEGLASWARLRTDWKAQWRDAHNLRPALRIAGIEWARSQSPGLLHNPNRRWFDLIEVKRVGDALVPAFGSRIGDRLRVLMTRGLSDVRTLLDWVRQDSSDTPVLVAVCGVLSGAQREALAASSAEHPEKVVMVLDDAALVYLAAYGGGRFATTERVLLPFAATNPYYPNAAGTVPGEMFYGRKREQANLIDPLGPSLIYGGRQLGKSALLHATARSFELVPNQVAIYLSLPPFGTAQDIHKLWDMIADALERREITGLRRSRRQPAVYVEETIRGWLDADRGRRLLLLLDECDRFFDVDADLGFAQTVQLRDLMNTTNRRFKPVFAGLHQVQRFATLPNQPLAHLGVPIAIGPLAPEPAYRLIHTPMEALGIRFAEESLVHRVLADCNYQPKLLQIVGEALVRDAVERRSVAGPPWSIDQHTLEIVAGSESVRQLMRETFDLTLNLDRRYKLIALVTAFTALEHGADHEVSTTELRDDCTEWWREGFAGQGVDEFRLLLKEMVGLGVLAAAGDRWRLRSSNVLRLLGTQKSIGEELESVVNWSAPMSSLSAEQARRQLGDGGISPLTEQQTADVVERRNQLRIVFGTPATGIGRVRTALQDQYKQPGAQFQLHQPLKLDGYRRLLREGTPGEKHRVVISRDLAEVNIDGAQDSIKKARELQPPSGVTRTAVVIVDAAAIDLLDVLTGSAARSDNELVPLRRVTEDGLRTWLASMNNHIATRFNDDAGQRRLLNVTGGWLLLLEDALRHAAAGRSAQQICDAILAGLETTDGAERLITASGIRSVPILGAAFNQLAEYDDWFTEPEFTDLVADVHPAPVSALRHLRLLAALDERGSDGALHAEPVLTRAWQTTAR